MARALNPSLKVERDERGAVAILVAASLTILLIAAAMVLDFGLARLDRQTNKAASDSAAVAGVASMGSDWKNSKPWAGVCTAVRYLKAQYPGMATAGLTDSWAWGDGSSVTSPCNDSAMLGAVCTPNTPATWATYRGVVGSAANPRLLVEVRGGYDVNDPTFPEESYSTLSIDRGRVASGGCDNLAVIITQKRKPGLGSLATAGDVTTRIRSVGRITLGERGKAPVALLILEQFDCLAVVTNGNTTQLFVHGQGTRPGLIHSDSVGNPAAGPAPECASNNSKKIVGGTGTIKAFRAATGDAVGTIGIRALLPGQGGITANAYDAPPAVVAEGAPGNRPEGRPLVTRAPVDARYLSAVTSKINDVNPQFSWTQAEAEAKGYSWVTPAQCGGSGISDTYNQDKLYLNCPGGAVFADTVFTGTSLIVNGPVAIKGNNTLSLPNATEFFVKGPGTGGVNDKGLDVDGTLNLHHNNAASCPDADSATSGRATLVLASGFLNQTATNSVLRLCHTTVITMGNTTSMPVYADPAPAPSDNARNGYLNITGGSQDWSAPNSKPGLPSDATDWAKFEDLALWTETSLPSRVGGNGTMRLQGVFMLPNANAFNIGGTGTQLVTNSQYVVRKLQANGGGTLDMAPDPNDSVEIEYFGDFVLVR